MIVDDEQGVGEELERALAAAARPSSASRATSSRVTPRRHPRWPRARTPIGGVKALVHLAALAEPQPAYGALPALLALAQALREQLEAAASAGGAVLLGATGLGGAFGVTLTRRRAPPPRARSTAS